MNLFKTISSTLIFVSIYSANALAIQINPIDTEFENCLNKDSTTAHQVECSYIYYESWDTELNSTYENIISKIDGKEQNALIESQRIWLLFRDSEFKAIDEMYYENFHGSMYYSMRISERAEVVKIRALQLKNRILFIDMNK